MSYSRKTVSVYVLVNKNRIFLKLISLITLQVFILIGVVYPEYSVVDTKLRVPMGIREERSIETISVALAEHRSDEYTEEITQNAKSIFYEIWKDDGKGDGDVVLYLGSGINHIIEGKNPKNSNFVNVDKMPGGAYRGGRFFQGDWLEDPYFIDNIQGELKEGEKITGVLFYNMINFIVRWYCPEDFQYLGLGEIVKEQVVFLLHFKKIWNEILPAGGDFVFIDYMPPPLGRNLNESQEIVYRIEAIIKNACRNQIEKITRIKDEKSSYIIGIVVRKRAEDAQFVLHVEGLIKNLLFQNL